MAAAPDKVEKVVAEAEAKVRVLVKSWSVHLEGVTHYAGEVIEVAKDVAEHLFKIHANGGGAHGAVPAPAVAPEPVVEAPPAK